MTLEQSAQHYGRIQGMAQRFRSQQGLSPETGLFGAVDAGHQVLIWDYGQLKLFYNNNRILIDRR